MFAPLGGTIEDPATGSANCALAGFLAHCSEHETASFRWRIAQGVEMGRPSVLDARAEKQDQMQEQEHGAAEGPNPTRDDEADTAELRDDPRQVLMSGNISASSDSMIGASTIANR